MDRVLGPPMGPPDRRPYLPPDRPLPPHMRRGPPPPFDRRGPPRRMSPPPRRSPQGRSPPPRRSPPLRRSPPPFDRMGPPMRGPPPPRGPPRRTPPPYGRPPPPEFLPEDHRPGSFFKTTVNLTFQLFSLVDHITINDFMVICRNKRIRLVISDCVSLLTCMGPFHGNGFLLFFEFTSSLATSSVQVT